jgi:hypothetical protein
VTNTGLISNHSREYLIGTVLVLTQIFMTVSLAAIVMSPWYSIYFNSMLVDQLLDRCRNPKGESYANFVLAPRQKQRIASTSSVVDMHLHEEQILAALRRREIPAWSIQEFRRTLEDYASLEMQAIATEKLIRCQLLAAKISLQQKDWKQAETLAGESLDDLKRLPSGLAYSPQRRYINAILDVSAQARRLEGNERAALVLEALHEKLMDPHFAERWYRENGLNGYLGDYPAEYIGRYALSTIGSSDKDDIEHLSRALQACSSPDMRRPTKFGIMKFAVAYSESHHLDDALMPLVLKAWQQDGANVPINSEEQAFVALRLYPWILAQHGSAAKIRAMRLHLVQAIKAGLIPRYEAQATFDRYLSEELDSKTWPPANPAMAQVALTEIERLLTICRHQKLDDTVLQSCKLWALVIDGQMADATRLARGLARPGTDVTPAAASQAAKGRKIWGTDVRQGALSSSLMAYCQHEQQGTKQQATEAWKLIDTALNSRIWNDDSHARLLMALADLSGATGQPALSAECNTRILSFVKRNPTLHIEPLDFYLLRTALVNGDVEAAANIYRQAKKAFGQDTYYNFCTNLLAYLRAYPLMSKKLGSNATAGNFPDEVFQATPDMTAVKDGKNSASHLRAILWLAQYEYCRGNLLRAEKLCQQIIEAAPAEKNEAYIAAADMLHEITEARADHNLQQKVDDIMSANSISAFRGTQEQLRCLYSIYWQMQKVKAAERVEALKKRIREVD